MEKEKKATNEFVFPETGVDIKRLLRDTSELKACPFYEISVLTGGHADMIVNGTEYALEKHDAVITKPGDEHSFMGNSSSVRIVLSVTKEEIGKLCKLIYPKAFDMAESFSPCKIKLSVYEIDHIIFVANNINLKDEEQREYGVALIKSLIVNILLAFCEKWKEKKQKTGDKPEWLESFMEEVGKPENFNKPLAELYGLSPYSQTVLNNYFQKFVGIKLVTFIKKKKMEHAVRQLSRTDKPIAAIAAELSYTTSHFIHEFNREFGSSPTMFRDKIRRQK